MAQTSAPSARGADSAPQRLRVGPQRALQTIAAAAQAARDGATVEVDAGTYTADVAVWTQRDLRLRAVGGRVRLLAAGAAAEAKGIWVVRAVNMSVEGFDFEGARVAGRNGAGIRLESGTLRVRDCSFMHNEMGLLTNNDADTELEIEDSEFAYNQRPDGHNHNLYAGTIKRLSVSGSYFHHAHAGHLLKSRAAHNDIRYIRLSDETGGHASYELEFPNGGIANVVGNIIEQSADTENSRMVAYGAEGYRWPVNQINLLHNTLVDNRREAGVFLWVAPGQAGVRVRDNVLVGAARFELPADAQVHDNLTLDHSAIATSGVNAYRLRSDALRGARYRTDAAPGRDATLEPSREYVHPRATVALRVPAALPGASQSPWR